MGMVTFVDETTSDGRADGWEFEVAEERLALRELIRRRVFREVAERRAAGLVKLPEQADAEQQAEIALTAFRRNGFLVLVGDRQVTDLDEVLDLPLGTEVTFLKLVALVGG
ncbi:hypothetical protein ADK52_24800 [Streptomyces sp. WM6372]|uniref:hypothetical protein n=1 Tax=Streptomyces sp. WM6372 TaxID=1415555 RepID=UPI0006AE79A6|nr:hypothetical protein [Streptomyces sp. WM6372]KOU21154.1 hypothetical protein ADK52_24800 [Streptomyces sp. WM6372]